MHLPAPATIKGISNQAPVYLPELWEAVRLYGTAELLDVSYEDELVLSLRGRAEDVARLSKTVEDGKA